MVDVIIFAPELMASRRPADPSFSSTRTTTPVLWSTAAMLEDNCAAVERITYTSPFSEEEMGERKTELANIDLDMAALEEEKKAFMQAYKDKLKPKKERKKTLLTDIKRGYEEITDECFKFMDRSTRTTGYYNGNGDLVKERPMEAQEMQKTVFEDIESTGTEG